MTSSIWETPFRRCRESGFTLTSRSAVAPLRLQPSRCQGFPPSQWHIARANCSRPYSRTMNIGSDPSSLLGHWLDSSKGANLNTLTFYWSHSAYLHATINTFSSSSSSCLRFVAAHHLTAPKRWLRRSCAASGCSPLPGNDCRIISTPGFLATSLLRHTGGVQLYRTSEHLTTTLSLSVQTILILFLAGLSLCYSFFNSNFPSYLILFVLYRVLTISYLWSTPTPLRVIYVYFLSQFIHHIHNIQVSLFCFARGLWHPTCWI
jgi:hypothetical protein